MTTSSQDSYFFVIFPRFLQTKGFVMDRKIPQFSISAFIDSFKVDEVTVVPSKEQTMYHTVFWLNSGRLQFQQGYHGEQQLVRIEVHDGGQLLGRVFLSSKDYILCMEEGKEHYYEERVKISETYEMDFQLFLAGSKYEIDELILEHRGESDIRTPITKQSQERKEDSELNFDMLKLAESELYTPGATFDGRRSIFQKIDEEQSINSSLPQSAPPVDRPRFSFKIDLQEVPAPSLARSGERVQFCDSGEVRRLGSLGWRQKATLYLFTGLGLVMIYLSMIPMRKI